MSLLCKQMMRGAVGGLCCILGCSAPSTSGAPKDAGSAETGAIAPGASPSTGPVAPASPTAFDDAGAVPAPLSDDGEPVDVMSSEGGETARAGDDSGVPTGTQWANWPMPNPPSSGLPNPESYDTSVPGIVLDRVTGLAWQQTDVATAAATMEDAAAYCAALALGGYDDWRLPSRIELWSIQDFAHVAPALDPVFSSVTSGSDSDVAPWTSTLGTPPSAYFQVGTPQSVDMFNGEASQGGTALRCLRGSMAQPSPHYTVQNGTVYDHGTKLTWQQSYDPIPSLPNGVANYCASLTLDGGGWRAPSVKELESIVEDDTVHPALDPVFLLPTGSTDDFVFWSCSAWAPAPTLNESWYVDFTNGSNGTGDNSIPTPPLGGNNNFFQVRCVK
jgi:hypothetical protein